jgi:hypothetical protein
VPGKPAALIVPLASLLSALAVAACGAGGSSAAGAARPSRPADGGTRASAALSGSSRSTGGSLAGAIASAKHIYGNETNGGRVHADLGLIASDRALLSNLGHGRLAAAQAEAHHLMTSRPIAHITRVSVMRGKRSLVNAVWNSNGSFVVAPLTRALSLHGHPIGTLLVSVQDIVGYVKLIHKYTGADAVVRGASGQARASFPAAATARLPASGHVTIARRHYVVGSFQVVGWEREPLTVWILEGT